MTTLGITGVTGHVGGRIARTLADRSVGGALSDPLVLIARTPSRAPQLGSAVSDVRQADYADGEGSEAALRGIDVLFMASGSENEHRRAEHRSFIAAAARAGVRHLVYTSFSGASPDAVFTLGRDHADAEQAIRDAASETGMTYTLLRDNFYSDLLPYFAGEDGVIRGPAGEGRVSAVARADVVDAAIAALTGPEAHANAVYELNGPEALSLAEVAERGGRALGRELRYQPETLDEAYASRRKWSEEQWQLDAWVSTYTAIADGEVDDLTDDVERITGHAPRTIEEALAEFPD